MTQIIELSKTILDTLSVYDIIYAEFAGSGAMGCAGQVLFYIIEKEQLVCYKTNLFKDEITYIQATELLLSHQNSLKSDNIRTEEILFNYYYGGVGNYVFVNKDVSLEITDEHFIYKRNKNEYHIYSSVLGVFISVADAMKKIENIKLQ